LNESKIIHDTISSSRFFNAAIEDVFDAWADHEKSQKWDPRPDGVESVSQGRDFSVGGIESTDYISDGVILVRFETRYLDIVENERIIYSIRVISPEGSLLSSSQNTIEFTSEDNGTRLFCTEQVAWLMGKSMRPEHESGWETLLGRLEAFLEE